MKMIIRKAEKKDLCRIMEIVDCARKYFAENSIPQWQDEYPSLSDFTDDIEGDRLYVAEEDAVLGVYCYDTRGDKNYEEIFEGAFHSDEPYAAIHRVAVAPEAKGMGIGGLMCEHAFSKAKSEGFGYMRGDTHALNLSMQRMLEKSGFRRCGFIYLGGIKDYKNQRVAFDKKL